MESYNNHIQAEPDKKPDEKKLFSEIKRRNHESFITAYDLYVDDIYRFIYFKVGDAEEAQDLTSTVFLKTWNYIQENNLKDFKTLRALIYKVARNSVIDYYRKNLKHERVAIDDENLGIDLPDGKPDLLKEAEINFDYGVMEDKLKNIKDEYREVVVLRYVNELSISEIAKVIDKSKGNVRVIISRALKSLREEIESSQNKTE